MTKLRTRKAVYERLEELERKHKIHEIKRIGFPIYQMTKVPIMGNLINEKVKNPKSGYAFDKLKNVSAKNVVKVRSVNPHNSKAFKTGVIFILRGLYNGEGKDNYLEKYISYEQEKPQNIYIIDREMGGEYHEHCYHSEYTTKDFQSLIKYQIPSEFKLSKSEQVIVEKFENDLRKEGYVGNYLKLFEHNMTKFYSEYTLYKAFIKEHKINRIYLSLAYTHLPLIKVAKDLKVETIEIQYGNISPMHGGFGSWNNTEIYSDVLGVWSEFYAQILTENPSKKVRSIPLNLKYPSITKKEQLLVVVQRLEIDSFIEQASVLRSSNPKLNIIYKFHPFHEISKKVKRKLKKLHINVVIDEIPSEVLINESRWVLSGYSTALIEANYAKSIPLVCREIPYSDEFFNFCKEGYMCLYEGDEITNYKICKLLSKNEQEYYPEN